MKNKEQLEGIERWYHACHTMVVAFHEMTTEKEALNYPISQSTEDMMFVAAKGVEFAMNALESEMHSDAEQKEVKPR